MASIDVFCNVEFTKCHSESLKSQEVKEIFDFNNKQTIGAGTYGKVYKVQKLDGEWLALKCIKAMHEKEGFPITSLREIKFLTQLQHENVIQIKDIYTTIKVDKQKIKRIKTYCAMDYLPYEFSQIIKQNYKQHIFLSIDKLRSILYQAFKGLEYIHQRRIIHRDIKSANILMNQDGVVKLADFGLAKYISKFQFLRLTSVVCTLAYRAPEVLLTKGQYDAKIDVWSMGCFALELSLNRPLFLAKDESEQIKAILDLCGTPIWPDLYTSEFYSKLNLPNYQRRFISHIRNQKMDFDDQLLDLLDRIFVVNPALRPDSSEVLKHPFFQHEISCDFLKDLTQQAIPQQKVSKQKIASPTIAFVL